MTTRRIGLLTATAALAIGAALALSGPGFAKGGKGPGGGAGGGGGASKNAKKTVLDEIALDTSLAKFDDAVKAAGLESMLKGSGPFTVLAPNDAAIAKVDAKWQEISKDKAKLKALIEAHIVSSKMTLADIGKATKLATGGNVSHAVKLGDDKLPMIDGVARIVRPDVQASNGYLQVLDAVLLPAEKVAGK